LYVLLYLNYELLKTRFMLVLDDTATNF